MMIHETAPMPMGPGPDVAQEAGRLSLLKSPTTGDVKSPTTGDEEVAIPTTGDEEVAIDGRQVRSRAIGGSQAVLVACGLIATAIAVDTVVRNDSPGWIVWAVTACGLLAAASKLRYRSKASMRVAIVGNQASAISLMQELETCDVPQYDFIGWVAPERDGHAEFPLPTPIGFAGDLACVVHDHDIDLLIVGPDVPRLAIFDELLVMATSHPVRALELSAFYEQVFGHIPVAEINSAWFQCTMHPKFRPAGSSAQRAFDVVVAACVGLVFLPILLVSALLIKLDGGPALYSQRRIGESGRSFWMFKLRTMHVASESEPQQWCAVEDARITGVGNVLRRLHLDELPQLYNVLRGDMSMVGPRPEQPAIVTQLEDRLAFYSRRHLIKPGLTGWAQIRCGYARSESGSARKLCHDLYYLKHQSLALDLSILVRTVVTLASARSAEPHASRLVGPSLDPPVVDQLGPGTPAVAEALP